MSNCIAYINPYTNQGFFSFFGVLIKRLRDLITGSLEASSLVSDEIQMLVLTGVAISCGIVGSFLVLRRLTMLANALSHTILIGIVLAYLIILVFGRSGDIHQGIDIQVLMIASLLTALLTTFCTEFLTKTVKLQEDASIGIVFTTFFALGILIITLFTRDVHLGTELVMGNVDALHPKDLTGVYAVLAINLVLIFIFFKEFKITTFDPGLSRVFGISPVFFNYFLMVLTSATVIGGFRAVGVLMILAFLVGPVLTARLLTHHLLRLILLSAFLGVLASLIGVALSRHLLSYYGTGFSTGGLTVCVIVAFYALAIIAAPQQGLIAQFYHQKQLRQKLGNHNL